MPSLEPTPPPAGRRRTAEPDPIAQQIQARLAALRDSEVNPEDAVEQGLLAIIETTEISAGAICLFDARQQVLRLAAERGLSDQGCKSLRHIRRGFSGAWDMPLQSLSNRRVYLIENAAQNRYVPPLIDEPDKMRTVLCLPLLTGTMPVGSLILVSTARKPFADQDLARLEGPGKELAIIIEAARARARQSERSTAAAQPPAPTPDQPHRDNRPAAESVIGQRFDPDQKIIPSREIAPDWQRRHQELAGELAAAATREQRLRDELTTAAERLQDLSQTSRDSGTKDEAAQLAQYARLQTSLAETESIAARERMRASEVDRKLAEMAELLFASTAREEAFRQLIDDAADSDPARRTQLIDQSLDLARLNARLAEAETALAHARSHPPAPESGAAAVDIATAAAQAERHMLLGELAAARAREEALQTELRAATEQHQRLLTDADDREQQREQTRSVEATQLHVELCDANDATQRANERLAAVEQRQQELAGQLAATSTREQALREELESNARNHQARVIELEALLEHERSLGLDWQRKHQALDSDHRAVVERERARLAEAIEGKESAAAQVAAAQDAELGIELVQLRERLADVEASGARDATRASEGEQRCGALTAQLEDVLARNAANDHELRELRGHLAARSANAAAAAAEKEVATESLTARLAAAEAARAAAEQSAASWAQRHDALAAEFESSVTRAEDLARALEAVRADTATDRVEAEGVRAAAQVEAETSRTALADAQQRADTLRRELEDLRGSARTREDQLTPLAHDRDAQAADQARQLAAHPLPASSEASARSTPAAAAPIAHAPVAVAAHVKSDVHRIAVVDDPAAWEDIKLHGVDMVLLSPTDDIAARLAETPVDRVLVNLAARGALDATLGARAAGATVPFCGCLIPPGLPRGLPLGFIEVARTPLDPDEIITVLAPFAVRGTRVLTVGADADTFISLRQALSRQGMSVSMAWDGKQASHLLQMVRPEVVIVDLDLPPRGGLPLIVELTRMPTMPMLVLLPGRQDLGKRTVAELGDSCLVSRLLPPDRLLEEVRRGGKPKA